MSEEEHKPTTLERQRAKKMLQEKRDSVRDTMGTRAVGNPRTAKILRPTSTLQPEKTSKTIRRAILIGGILFLLFVVAANLIQWFVHLLGWYP